MTRNPHLLARCLEPVAMTEADLRVCIAVVSGDEFFAEDRARALEAAGGLPMLGEPRAALAVEGGVATIAVEGPLVRKAAGIQQASGLTGYDAIRKDLRAALADPKVQSIAWAFDSPGGEVSGLFELADEIAAARDRKPMRALVARANSAAYVLAAAVGNIEIEQLGQAGSIGVIAGLRRPGAEGETIEFVSSVSPLKNLDASSDEGRADFQRRVDYAGERLVEKVAALRGVSVAKVLADFGRGSVMQGKEAVAAGLADRVIAVSTPTKGARQMNPTIFGLAVDASEDAVRAEAQALVAFRSRALALAAADDADTALGTFAAAMESHRAHPAAQERIAALEANENRREMRVTLERGLAASKLDLGRIRGSLVDMVGIVDEGKAGAMRAALDAIPEKLPDGTSERDAVLDAVCSVDPGAGGLRAARAFVKNATAVAAQPIDEPARDAAGDADALEKSATASAIAEAGKKTREHFAKKSTQASAK